MLTIRMQRVGRKGHPTYRVVVQDVRQTPTSGRYVALLGSYDPHRKTSTLVKEKTEFYLKNGARPSDRVIRLLSSEGIKIPDWVKIADPKSRQVRNPDKLSKNQPATEKPAEEVAVAETEAPTEEVVAAEPEAPAEATPAEETSEVIPEAEAPVEPEAEAKK